jgi:hypothetical protein
MSYDNIDRTKDNAEYAVAGIKKAEENGLADIKATGQKLKADAENLVDHVKANETADVARLKADAGKVGEDRRADHVKADVNANIEKAHSDVKRFEAYAAADAENARTHANP